MKNTRQKSKRGRTVNEEALRSCHKLFYAMSFHCNSLDWFRIWFLIKIIRQFVQQKLANRSESNTIKN